MPAKLYDIKTEREVTLAEAAEMLLKAIKEGKLPVAAYYNRLVARLLIEEMRERQRGGAGASKPSK